MMRRRDFLRDSILSPLGLSVALGALAVAGCGGEYQGPPPIPLGKSKDDSQKESELPPGLEQLQPKKKKRGQR